MEINILELFLAIIAIIVVVLFNYSLYEESNVAGKLCFLFSIMFCFVLARCLFII